MKRQWIVPQNVKRFFAWTTKAKIGFRFRIQVKQGKFPVLYLLSGFFFVLSLIFILLQFSPLFANLVTCNSALAFVVEFLTNVGSKLNVVGITAAVGLLGVTGVAFAWLVAATDREVFGVPIGDLIDYQFPKTYTFYLFFFLPQLFLAIYAGNAKMTQVAFFSSIGVLLAAIHLLRVCYFILLNRNKRESIVYDYYASKLRIAICQPNSLHQVSSIVERTAMCAHEQLMVVHYLHGEDTATMWIDAVKCLFSMSQEGGDNYEAVASKRYHFFREGLEHDELAAVLLMEDCWYVLLQGTEIASRRKLAIHSILESIDTKPYKKPEEIAVIAGLVLALYDIYGVGDTPFLAAWKEVDQLFRPIKTQSYSRGLSPILYSQIRLAFGMLLASHILFSSQETNYDNAQNRSLLRTITNELENFDILTLREQLLLTKEFQIDTGLSLLLESQQFVYECSKEGNLELLLWYIEWSAIIKNPDYDESKYLEIVKKGFLGDSVTDAKFSPYHPDNMYYRALLLLTL